MNTRNWIGIGLALAAFLAIRRLFGQESTEIANTTGQEPTLTPANFQAMANTIEGLALSAGGPLWEDEEAISLVILLCSNNADVVELLNAYGKRGRWWSATMDLGTTVRTLFSTDEVNSLNERLTAKGINILF
jgi:hypothetical protein